MTWWRQFAAPILTSTDIFLTGFDPTGVVDASPIFQSAIDSLPSTGGRIYLPPGDLVLNTGLTIGNGLASGTLSTRNGVQIIGAAPPSMMGLDGNPTIGPTRLVSGTPGMTLLTINGPITGCSLQNLHFYGGPSDGSNNAAYGLVEKSCTTGDHKNLLFQWFTNTAHSIQGLPQGPFGGTTVGHDSNRYQSVAYQLPSVANTIAISITGNVDFNSWQRLTFFFIRPGSAVVQTGIYIAGGDNNFLHDINYFYYDASGLNLSTSKVIRFDYSSASPLCYSFDNVDFAGGYAGASGAVIENIGVPSNGQNPHRFSNIRTNNGITPNPGLLNTIWEGVKTQAGAPVAADIPAGTSIVWRDTSGGTTKLYYNNAGTLMSVSLA